jgi:hypothetical protein
LRTVAESRVFLAAFNDSPRDDAARAGFSPGREAFHTAVARARGARFVQRQEEIGGAAGTFEAATVMRSSMPPSKMRSGSEVE